MATWLDNFQGSPFDRTWSEGTNVGTGCSLGGALPPPGAPAEWSTQALRAQNTTGAAQANAGHENGTAYPALYWRLGFYVNAFADGGDYQRILYTASSGYGEAVGVFLLRTSATTFTLRVRIGGAANVNVDVAGLDVQTFYTLRVMWNATAGAYEVRLGDSTVGSGAIPSGAPASTAVWYLGCQDEAHGLDVYLDLFGFDTAGWLPLPATGGVDHPLAGSAGLALSAGGALSVGGEVALSGAASMGLSGTGALSGVTVPGAVYKIYVDWDADGGFSGPYDDVTADRVGPVRYRLGFARPGDRMAAVGTARFTLDNSWFNQHGAFALYSKGNAASPLAGRLVPMRPVKIAVEVGGIETALWTGFVEQVVPGADEFTAEVTCVDGLAALDVKVDVPLQTNRRGDELIATLLDEAFDGITTLLDASPQTYEQAGDNWLPEETNVYQAIREVAEAENGRFWVDADGQAVYWDTYHPYEATVFDAAVDAESVGLRARGPVGDVYNHVILDVRPRQASAANVALWESGWQFNPRIKGDDTYDLHVRFRDAEGGGRLGAEDVIEPVKGVDLNASYRRGGGPSDDDANGDITVRVFAPKGSTAIIALKNTGNDTIYVTYLRVRGTAIYTYDIAVYTAEDAASQGAYSFGKPKPLERRFKLPLTADHAQRLADHLLAQHKDPRIAYEMTCEVTGSLTLDDLLAMDVMSLVAVTDPASGLSADAFRVVGVDGEIDGLHRVTLTLERYFNPAPGYLIVGSASRGRVGTNLVGPF